MQADRKDLLLADVMAEYVAVFEGDWKPKTKRKYEDDFRRLREWLEGEGQPLTTGALDFGVLLRYVGHLKEQPAVSGVWRGNPDATARARRSRTARTVSLNTVNSYMRPIKSLCLWARDQGIIETNPFGRGYRRSKHHPLLPTEETPAKGASLDDLRALERGCTGSAPLDLRDQAIVSVMKTTGVRNSSVRLLLQLGSGRRGRRRRVPADPAVGRCPRAARGGDRLAREPLAEPMGRLRGRPGRCRAPGIAPPMIRPAATSRTGDGAGALAPAPSSL